MNNKYERVALQYPSELAAFIRLLKQENINSYLEIGSKFGGSFWQIVRTLPKGSRAVAVDLPHGDTSFKESQPHLEHCVKRLRNDCGYDTHLFLGDSTDPEIIERVMLLGPFDACLIDANHTEPYVRADWGNYGQLARIVAFHDIGYRRENRPLSKKYPIHVPLVWAELKQQFRHVEIKMDPTRQDNGFGVLWRC
jgi:cephalosporin hydroxylase